MKLENLPPGQISDIECRMLYQLASEAWTGRGEIVEVGSLFGKSTVCLARGMAANPHRKIGQLHAFDKWMVDDETEYMMGQLTPGYRGSFRKLFDENTEAVKQWIIPHEGDTTFVEWCGKPIEILFLDCSVSKDFHEMLFQKFFPFLRRGSIVIHQDYFFYRSYYLPLMMEKLCFYLSERGSRDTSMVYEMVERLPQEMFDSPLVGSDEEIVWILEKEIAFRGGVSSPHGAIIATMLVYFHRLRGDKRADALAKSIADGIRMQIKPDAVIRNLHHACA